MEKDSTLMKPIEIGHELGVSTSRVYQFLFEHESDLPSIKIGHLRFVKRADWEAFLSAHGGKAPGLRRQPNGD